MASPFSWPVSVPSALRAPAPVNLGVRPKHTTSSIDEHRRPHERISAGKPRVIQSALSRASAIRKRFEMGLAGSLLPNG